MSIGDAFQAVKGYGDQPGIPLFVSLAEDLNKEHINSTSRILQIIQESSSSQQDATSPFLDTGANGVLHNIRGEVMKLSDSQDADMSRVYPLLYKFATLHHAMADKTALQLTSAEQRAHVNATVTTTSDDDNKVNLDSLRKLTHQHQQQSAKQQQLNDCQSHIHIIREIFRLTTRGNELCIMEDKKAIEHNYGMVFVVVEVLKECETLLTKILDHPIKATELSPHWIDELSSYTTQVKQRVNTLRHSVIEVLTALLKQSMRFLYKRSASPDKTRHMFTVLMDGPAVTRGDLYRGLEVLFELQAQDTFIGYLKEKMMFIFTRILNQDLSLRSKHPYHHLHTNSLSPFTFQVLVSIPGTCIVDGKRCSCRKMTVADAITRIKAATTTIITMVHTAVTRPAKDDGPHAVSIDLGQMVMRQIGSVLWPLVYSQLTAILFSSSVPLPVASNTNTQSNESKLDAMIEDEHAWCSHVMQLERDLRSNGLIHDDSNSFGPWMADVKALKQYKHHRGALERARELVTTTGFTVYKPPVIAADGNDWCAQLTATFLRDTQCSVTVEAVALLHLVHSLISQNQADVPLARDVLTVFISLFPSFWQKQLLDIPTLSFLCHNDCLLICRHITALHLKLLQRVDDDLDAPDRLLLIDLVEPVNALGLNVLTAQIQQQKTQLCSLLDSGLFHRGENDELEYIDVEDEEAMTTLTQVRKQYGHSLQRLHTTCNAVMPVQWTRAFFGKLLSESSSKILRFVFTNDDITMVAAASFFSLVEFFLSFVSQPGEISDRKTLCDARDIPVYARLRSMLMLLHPDQSLAKISATFKRGELTSFNPIELDFLIKALFMDSPKREACLQLFQP